MDIVRRNTDYALRLMVNLARNYGKGPVPTRTAAGEEDVPYQLACKLMQKLNKAKLVESCMGPRGGFELGREPSKINLLEVIESIQGPISVNRCLLSAQGCPRHKRCTVKTRLEGIQEGISRGLAEITFDELASGRATK